MIIESRTNASAAVAAALQAAKTKPEVVIQASAVGVYGNRGDEVLTEISAPVKGYFPAKIRVRWEQAIQGVAEHTRLAIIRTGIVLSGKRGRASEASHALQVVCRRPFR